MKKIILAFSLLSTSLTATSAVTSVPLQEGWPEVITCKEMNDGREWAYRLTSLKNSNGETAYSAFYGNTSRSVLKYNNDGTFSGISNAGGSWDCAINSWSINELIVQKRAFFSFYYQPSV